MESRHVHTYYMYLKPLNGGFIIPLISFSSLLASFFEKLYGLIWASCPSNKMYMKEENNRN